jgi:hypothetical protein
MKQNIEVEGGELVLQSDEGHFAVIPAKHRREVQDMIKMGCNDCVNAYIQTLPTNEDYAEDGTLINPDDPPKNYLFVDSKDDERYKAYNDSLNLYNKLYKNYESDVINFYDRYIDISNDVINNTTGLFSDKEKEDSKKRILRYQKEKLPYNVKKDFEKLGNKKVKIKKFTESTNPNAYIVVGEDNVVRRIFIDDASKTKSELNRMKNNSITPYIVNEGEGGGRYYIDKPKQPVFVKGTKEYDNAQKQVELKEAGLYSGEIDGIWGKKSQKALENYEKMQKETTEKPKETTDKPKETTEKPNEGKEEQPKEEKEEQLKEEQPKENMAVVGVGVIDNKEHRVPKEVIDYVNKNFTGGLSNKEAKEYILNWENKNN